ncbi:hypothetical protein ACJBU6_08455 [Exserohilum turcicum]
MVRASSIIALVFTMVCGTQAANWYCQCLYPDGSHCCVIAGLPPFLFYATRITHANPRIDKKDK